MSSCKTTNFPNGIKVGKCLELDPGTELPTFPEMIIEVDSSESPYMMTGNEDIIFCTGIVEVVMIPLIEAVKSFIVNADGGTVMMTPDGADTIQTAMITDGNTAKLGPKLSTTQWRDI